MGRAKSYDRDVLVDRAMKLFWLHGFHGTSTATLVDRLGINRNSMYLEFGSKQALYEAAMERYERDVVQHHFGELEGRDAGLDEIRTVLARFAVTVRGRDKKLGCLMCNAATERAPHDAASKEFVSNFVDRIGRAFARAISNAKRRGEIGSDVEAADEASWFTATLIGFFVLMRAQAAPKVRRSAARAALKHLDNMMIARTGFADA